MSSCRTSKQLSITGNAELPVASAGDGVGAVFWLENFNAVWMSFFDGGSWGTPTKVLSSNDSLFLVAVGGNPNANQYYPLFRDTTNGTLNALEVNSQGTSGAGAAESVPAAASAVSLGSFDRGVISVDPTTGTVYVGAQSGFAQPQLFVSNDNGSTFTAGPTLPTLPSASLLNGIAANSGILAVFYTAGGSENAIILASGGSTFGSPLTMFTDSNGSFSVNGAAMNSAGTLAVGLMDTPTGGSTSALQSVLASGGSIPTMATFASGVGQFPQPGGGIQSSGDTAFGYDDPGELFVGQVASGQTTPALPLDTGLNAPDHASVSLGTGSLIAAGLNGASNGILSAAPCP